MKLFFQFEKPDPQKILEGVRKAYGVKSPEKINGFMGTFLSGHLDVYLTDSVADLAECRKEFRAFLDECITRFYHDDWGFVTQSESWENGESRYLGACISWMIARYHCQQAERSVVYANLYDIALISFIEEDVTAVYKEQFLKDPYHVHCTLDSRFLNELKYVRNG